MIYTNIYILFQEEVYFATFTSLIFNVFLTLILKLMASTCAPPPSWRLYIPAAVATSWPLATMFARCVARSLTYSWVYGTINPLRDSLITEVIKHLNVQTRWAPTYMHSQRDVAGSRVGQRRGRGESRGQGRRARQAVTN